MKLLTEMNPSILILDIKHSNDVRGFFRKVYSENEAFCMDFGEIFYTSSAKDTIRGMHFQIPPYDGGKLIHLISGKITDVVVDLRKESPMYGTYMAVELNAEDPVAIYIPEGFAHGFASHCDHTIMLYGVTSVYHPECDCGIAWDSIGYDWGIENPILSERDQCFPRLDSFISPF